MATTTSSPPCHISVSFLRQLPPCTTVQFFGFSPTQRKLGGLTVARNNLAQDFLGDFGARDPYPAEIASQFGDKVLGPQSTEHKILIPNASVLSLSQLECSPVSPSQAPLSPDEAKTLLHKVNFLTYIFNISKCSSVDFLSSSVGQNVLWRFNWLMTKLETFAT